MEGGQADSHHLQHLNFFLVDASIKMSADQSIISKSELFFSFNNIVTASPKWGQLRLRD